MIRADYIFSYWIYIWYILFYLGSTIVNANKKWVPYNPLFALIVTGILEFIQLGMLLYYSTIVSSIPYILVIFLLKLFPIYTIYKIPLKQNDYIFTCILFLIYLGWLQIHQTNLYEVYVKITDSLIYGKNQTPLLHLFHTIINQN